ncbi:bifunctional DNA-formamidopyrimidine glycosylase/DNA-(apurinic or apyrimidinic site) lyase [Planctomicrobium sp. SH664]|uniref:bifunctional DNA-formamidopyrimidine glycosylase/DNA-(apurinic or apyrimidinic site) lyase n=1 Tax=Planctomicrobium sp. SH664 TaxID=3448125 RepID=UPI003F5BA057
MPELPEVETMVRGIRPLLEGARLIDVAACDCQCKPILLEPQFPEIRQRSIGQRIESVERRAKRVLIHLEQGDSFVIEPRMTGLMLIDSPPDQEHLRCCWTVSRNRRKQSVWFWDRRGLGTIRLLSADQREQVLGDSRLGPDALLFTSELWRERLAKTARPIKVALLDQKLIAGIGNLYASEILHLAGIHPETAANALSSKRRERLQIATQEILQTAIRYEGSTLGDGTYRNALNKAGSYQNAHRVYDRADEACPTCQKGKVLRIVQAQRSTFFCPRCQK